MHASRLALRFVPSREGSNTPKVMMATHKMSGSWKRTEPWPGPGFLLRWSPMVGNSDTCSLLPEETTGHERILEVTDHLGA